MNQKQTYTSLFTALQNLDKMHALEDTAIRRLKTSKYMLAQVLHDLQTTQKLNKQKLQQIFTYCETLPATYPPKHQFLGRLYHTLLIIALVLGNETKACELYDACIHDGPNQIEDDEYYDKIIELGKSL